jgi:uncharacterized protein YkwD
VGVFETGRRSIPAVLAAMVLAGSIAAGSLQIGSPDRASAAVRAKPVVPTESWRAQPSFELVIVDRINAVRRHAGLRALSPHLSLRRAARSHSKYLAVKVRDLEHEGADGSPFWTRLVRAGYPRWSRMAENLGLASGRCRPSDPAGMVQAWMESPPHRRNILDDEVHRIGVGVVSTRNCALTISTADFGG